MTAASSSHPKGDGAAGARAVGRALTAIYVPVLLVLGWQWLGSSSEAIRGVISSPFDVARALASGVADGSVVADIGASLHRALLGWAITVALATPLAITAGRVRIVGRLLLPVVDLMRPISPIAWIPLAVLWLGIGLASKLLVVFIVTFFVVFLNVYDAVTRVPPVLLNVCRTFTASRWFLWKQVILPGSMQGVVLGSQYGLTTAWGGVIVAELVGANSGVGFQMLAAANQFEPARVIAYMLLVGLVGLMLNAIFVAIVGKTRWAPAKAST